jgi:ribosomal protein L37E
MSKAFMKSVYIPDGIKIPKDGIDKELYGVQYYTSEDFVEEMEDGLFSIGQSYDETPAKTLVCKRCGGNQFNVGQGGYFTAIKCVTCQYEVCVHDG